MNISREDVAALKRRLQDRQEERRAEADIDKAISMDNRHREARRQGAGQGSGSAEKVTVSQEIITLARRMKAIEDVAGVIVVAGWAVSMVMAWVSWRGGFGSPGIWLLQLCSGAVYDISGGVMEVHDCKVEAFLEVIEQLHGEHALVFYWFQHERDRLVQALKKTGKRVEVYQGAEQERQWNAGQIDVLLAHPASCAYGLNLQQGGHHVVWFGYPNWTLELYQQANARLYRQGQTQPVIAHLLVVQDGVDEDVVASLHDKGDTQEALMAALKARIREVRGEDGRKA